MIPLRDNIQSSVCPYTTILLILANAYIFSFEGTLPVEELKRFLLEYGLVPMQFVTTMQQNIFSTEPYSTLISHQFLHGGWLHLVGNMWFLWVFAKHVESKLGHLSFLFFYLFCGITADLVQVVAYPDATNTLIGASGAVSGILGAYIMCYPKAKIKMFIPMPFFPIAEVQVMVFVLIWFGWQLLCSTFFASVQDVAWWSHLGGFIVGMFFVRLVPTFPD